MPRYIYECDSCGHSHEEVHSMSENPEILCPECSHVCFRAIQPAQGFVKGNCYLNKKDCKKAAAISKLQEDDPYSKHRQPGEADELVSRIKRNKLNI